jgi:hypothetical protein
MASVLIAISLISQFELIPPSRQDKTLDGLRCGVGGRGSAPLADGERDRCLRTGG